MKEKFMPPVVLTLICVIVSALLVVAYNVTYVDTTGVLTEKLKESFENILGESDFVILTTTDSEGKKQALEYGDVVNVIIDKNSDNIILEVVADGYTKDGIDILVGIDKDGKVIGTSVVSLAETPGLGTKVNNDDFLSKFKSADKNTDFDKLDGITGATYSSKGVKSAVKTAISTFEEKKDEILSVKNAMNSGEESKSE